MPDYDMSDTACRARAKHQKEHDQALKDIKELKEFTNTLETRINILLGVIATFRPEVRAVVEDCLKGESSA